MERMLRAWQYRFACQVMAAFSGLGAVLGSIFAFAGGRVPTTEEAAGISAAWLLFATFTPLSIALEGLNILLRKIDRIEDALFGHPEELGDQ